MGSVLAREAHDTWKTAGSDVLQADEADSGNGMTVVKLRTERRRQMTLHDRWINSEVNQQPSLDRAMYLWKPYTVNLLLFSRTALISVPTT